MKGRRKGSLSGFMTKRPSNSAAEQCQALTGDSSTPTMAWTARFALVDRKFTCQPRGNKGA